MTNGRQAKWILVVAMLLMLMALGAVACGQGNRPDGEPAPQSDGGTRSALDFIKAGGPVGYLILLLSVVGVALVVDGFLRFRRDRLMPPVLVSQSEDLAKRGRFSELLTASKSSDSMLGRVLGAALEQGQLGVPAVREAAQEAGTIEMTRLQQRVAYIGFIASVAPMLGLLGTVTGMISSFNVLGMAKGAARPDQLAVGVSEALVTTCMGLVVAVPLMFLHSVLQNRLTRLGQEASGHCERLMQVAAALVAARNAVRASDPSPHGPQARPAPSVQTEAQPKPASPTPPGEPFWPITGDAGRQPPPDARTTS